MRLYEGTLKEFTEAVLRNWLADQVAASYKRYYGKTASLSEYRAWQQSLNFLKNAFESAQMQENKVVVEYELPYSTRRIDVLIFGRDESDNDSIVLIELKQWSNESVSDAESPGNIVVDYGRFKKEQAHPSLQVEGYHYDLKDFLTVFSSSPPVALTSCAYCHNYSRMVSGAVLFLPKFHAELQQFQVFAKEDAEAFSEFLRKRLARGGGAEVFSRFTTSPIRPSKKLLEHTSEMIHKQQIFNLIDDQIAAYNAIMHKAKALARIANKKSVVIVKGGPGTGKSVIALEVMGELMRDDRPAFHLTGSSAFTNTLRSIVGVRAKGLFKFFNSFSAAQPDSIEVLICDEAHRIRRNSNSRYTPRAQRSNVPQIEELFRVAKLLVFFIDENQVVRPEEIGNVDLIRATAKRFGVEGVKLQNLN